MDPTVKRILEVIDQNREAILAFARDIYDHAELGYKEHRTSAAFIDQMRSLGLLVQDGLAITGAKAYLNPDKADIASVALIGELDALRIPNHPHFNVQTQGAHCCGHHAQLAGVLGAAMALTNPEVTEALDGQVIFFAVPAEEYGEIAFKNSLIEQGKIRYGGGKCELIRIGAFEDVDVAVAHHTGGPGITLGHGSNNGFVSKVITYHGRAAHAAGAPEQGINALSAASLGLQALALNRETFRDEDCVRVHPIMTNGGDLVNVIPETATLETLVRGKTLAAIQDAHAKTDRSFLAGAIAMGADLTIETVPGYLPSLPQAIPDAIVDAVRGITTPDRVHLADLTAHSGGSTDVGDVQHLLPVLTFNTGGTIGSRHSSDFDVVDEDEAYLDAARVFAIHAYELLKNKAALARQMKADYHPRFSNKEEYIQYLEQFRSKEEWPQKPLPQLSEVKSTVV